MSASEDEDMQEAVAPRAAPTLQAPIHYGTIQAASAANASFQAGLAAGNIHTADTDAPTLQLPEGSKAARAQQEALLQQVELRRRLRATVVPTDVGEVRALLRRLEQPVTLFGERELERRERLRKLVAAMEEAGQQVPLARPEGGANEAAPPSGAREQFFTEGPPQLQAARVMIACFSVHRAGERVARAKRRRADPDEDEIVERRAALTEVKRLMQQSSEIGDERPISGCAFSADGSSLATCAWSGLVKLWALPSCTKQLTIKAHDDRVTGVAWHPGAQRSSSLDSLAVASASADTTARLWSQGGRQLTVLTGHTDRLARLAFHPAGRHLATASFDQTWRLWDVETGACLAEQEGHSRALYTVAFHPDGSLAASGGLDGIGRIWDLRTGRSIMTLQGHVSDILALDFSPDGVRVASGSADHTARIWDLRKRTCASTLPGHTSLVAQVCFEPNDGHYLLTAGYDNAVKVWGTHGCTLVRTLAGHEGKVMGADISPDSSNLVATVSYDRTLKLWAPDVLV